jgi:hypothetical protein
VNEALNELRSRTAAHEAGHCLLVELSGLRVVESRVVTVNYGSTTLRADLSESDGLHEAHLFVAVAGYAAVGAVFGPEVEIANRAEDIHSDPDSDLWRALVHASGLESIPDGLVERILNCEAIVRDILMRGDVLEAVRHIGEVLFEYGHISGEHVRGVMLMYNLQPRPEPGPPT